MSRCLCCQKEIEGAERYHPKCLNKLFGVSWIPKIPFGIGDMPAEVSKSGAKMSISGVQIKASVKLDRGKQGIAMVQTGGTHVLKAEPNEYPELPQNENCCMNIAQDLGMDVPPHGLFFMADGKLGYVIKRFDRLDNGDKIHKESMAQILSIKTEDKYKGSLEKVGKTIQQNVKNIGLDLINFFERVLLSFLVGNGDMHMKNWALITLPNGEMHLAPCYDFVCSKIHIPNEEDFALTINGRKNEIRKRDFTALGMSLKIEPKAIENVLNRFKDASGAILEAVSYSELSTERKKRFDEVIRARYERLFRKV